jgi:hypothetical protein
MCRRQLTTNQLAAIMFLRCKVRRKDGKQHRYWSVVEKYSLPKTLRIAVNSIEE